MGLPVRFAAPDSQRQGRGRVSSEGCRYGSLCSQASAIAQGSPRTRPQLRRVACQMGLREETLPRGTLVVRVAVPVERRYRTSSIKGKVKRKILPIAGIFLVFRAPLTEQDV